MGTISSAGHKTGDTGNISGSYMARVIGGLTLPAQVLIIGSLLSSNVQPLVAEHFHTTQIS